MINNNQIKPTQLSKNIRDRYSILGETILPEDCALISTENKILIYIT